jgi:hypothetical protein
MSPKTMELLIVTSTSFPANAFTAGIDVTAATKETKKKLTFDLMECGNSEIAMIPDTGKNKANKKNKDPVIDIRYSDFSDFSC